VHRHITDVVRYLNISLSLITSLREGCEILRWTCLYVCMSVRSQVSKTVCPNFKISSVHVNCVRGSVLLWLQCNTLCTSGFVDDVVFCPCSARQRRCRRAYTSTQSFTRGNHRGVLWCLRQSCMLLILQYTGFVVQILESLESHEI